MQSAAELLFYSLHTIMKHNPLDRVIAYFFMRPVEVDVTSKIASSLNSLGQQLSPSFTPSLFGICYNLCMRLRVAMTELMVWSREGCSGDAMLLSSA